MHPGRGKGSDRRLISWASPDESGAVTDKPVNPVATASLHEWLPNRHGGGFVWPMFGVAEPQSSLSWVVRMSWATATSTPMMASQSARVGLSNVRSMHPLVGAVGRNTRASN